MKTISAGHGKIKGRQDICGAFNAGGEYDLKLRKAFRTASWACTKRRSSVRPAAKRGAGLSVAGGNGGHGVRFQAQYAHGGNCEAGVAGWDGKAHGTAHRNGERKKMGLRFTSNT